MKKIIFMLMVLFGIHANAQDYNFSIDTYGWDKEAMKYSPTEADAKYSSVVMLSKNIYQYSFNDEKSLVKYRCLHTIILLNDDKAIEDNNKIYFSVNDKNSIKKINTRVIENGKIISTNGIDDIKMVSEDGQDYLILAINGLKKGTLLETVLIVENPLEVYGTNYVQRNVPVKKYEFQLMSPSYLLFKTKVYNSDAKAIDSLVDEQIITYIKFENLAAAETELNSLGNGNKARIEYTYYKNTSNNTFYTKYSETAKRYSEGMLAQYDESLKKLSSITKKLALDGKSEEEKIFIIENYIKTNYEIKKGIPNTTIPEIIKSKYGNSYSINTLFCYLLKSQDIKFEIVITCPKSDKLFDENFESLAFLDNTIFYFPKISKYSDPEYFLARVGKISTDYLGQYAIHTKFIDVGGVATGIAYMKMIPKNTEQDGTAVEIYSMKVDPSASKVFVNFKREMYGYADQNIRAAYFIQNDDARKELIEEFVKGMANDGDVKNIQIDNFEITDYAKFNAPFLISADVESTHYLEDAGDKLLLNIGEVIGLQQELYDTKPRVNPVDLDFVHIYKRKITLEIPAGYECKGLEKININNVFKDQNNNESLGFTSRYELSGNILTIYCDEYYKELTYPVSLYEKYRTVINSAADFNKISILLEKKN